MYFQQRAKAMVPWTTRLFTHFSFLTPIDPHRGPPKPSISSFLSLPLINSFSSCPYREFEQGDSHFIFHGASSSVCQCSDSREQAASATSLSYGDFGESESEKADCEHLVASVRMSIFKGLSSATWVFSRINSLLVAYS